MAKGREAFYRMHQAAAEADMQDISLDEINEEIRLVRDTDQRYYGERRENPFGRFFPIYLLLPSTWQDCEP